MVLSLHESVQSIVDISTSKKKKLDKFQLFPATEKYRSYDKLFGDLYSVTR